jgi:hypothetical protein
VPIEGASAAVGGLKLVAESRGGRRNQIDTLLVRRVEEPSEDGSEETRGSSGRGTTRAEEPARVEG